MKVQKGQNNVGKNNLVYSVHVHVYHQSFVFPRRWETHLVWKHCVTWQTEEQLVNSLMRMKMDIWLHSKTDCAGSTVKFEGMTKAESTKLLYVLFLKNFRQMNDKIRDSVALRLVNFKQQRNFHYLCVYSGNYMLTVKKINKSACKRVLLCSWRLLGN